MLTVQIPKEKAEQEKRKLLEKGVFSRQGKITSNRDFVYFPVIKKYSTRYTFVRKKTEHHDEKKITSLRDAIAKHLTKAEQAVLRTAYDLVGDIAIIEIPEELEKKETLIAETLLASNKKIKTVAKKVGIHGGEFRTQKLKILAGKRTKETIYREHGICLKLHVENVYFSPRLSAERKRIADQVKPGETILVMFSGCGPYLAVLGKHTKAKELVGVEINPLAHKYAEENMHGNKINNAQLYQGDVRKIVPSLQKTFDRIIMPLPRSADSFLDIAFSVAKPRAMIHLYSFGKEEDLQQMKKNINKIAKKESKGYKISKTITCGQYAPRKFRFCTDILMQ